MRAFVLTLLVLAGLAPAGRAQDTFEDPDFGASMILPMGMREVSVEERARLAGVTLEEARNVPRGQAPSGKVSHVYVWIDESTPYNRQISLNLYDEQPPFRTQAQLKEAHEQQGMSVDFEEILPPPLNGVRLEGTFLRDPDNVPMRRSVVYVPDLPRQRWALLSIQAFAGDWDIVKPELLRVVQSLKLEGIRMGIPAGRVPPAARPGTRGVAGGPGAAGKQGADDWLQLEVVGSLLLAAVLLGGLILGGRATP
jgi:hypothetical protein